MEVWNLLEKSGQSRHVLESTTKNWPHVQEKVGKMKKENSAKGGGLGYPYKVGRWPLVADRPLPAICLTAGSFPQTPLISNFLGFFLFLFLINFWCLGMGLAFGENGCTTLPFFEPCPYNWEGEIFHFSWSLGILFFSNFIFWKN
jgi:hypothetical protein